MRHKPAILSLLILLACALSFLLSACGGNEKTYRIGISQCSQDDWREKMNEEIRREVLLHDNVEVEIRSADDSNEKQIQDIRYFHKNGFDMLIVSPNEAEALTPMIKEVYEKGMPVIIFDRNINGDTYTARIGVDDKALGESAARYARNLAGTGAKAIEICGRTGSTPAIGRHTGFTEEWTKEGGKVLASVTGNWNEEEAGPLADSLLRLYPETDLIYAHNDRMAIGASRAARKLGRIDIKVIGIDAAPKIGIQAVADSLIDATFLYPTEGHLLIQKALDILEGKPYSKEEYLPLSSAVDKTNADILLLQDKTLTEETGKIKILQSHLNDYWKKHSSQTTLLYASITIIILLFGVAFLLLMAYRQRIRHQKQLMAQNRLLEEERDKQKKLNEQLQVATNAKLVFFTNVSHDLRTPLALISEPIARLAEAHELTDKDRTLARLAHKNVLILKNLINQILDFRKYENDKLTLNLQETDLAAYLREWMESFSEICRKRDLTLTLDIQDDTSFRGAIDRERMRRIIFNLVSNAVKYTPDNGRITVSLKKEDGKFIIAVRDTGKGIPAKDIENIFDRFYQVDSIRPQGSGIGLNLVKAFVELHGGGIKVDSTPGKGSVFTVEIPERHIEDGPHAGTREPEEHSDYVKDTSGMLEDIEPETECDASKPLLLIIDDNGDIRTMLRELLGNDYNIVVAANGKEGLRLASKYVPDLIICDMMMPEMDGIECCRAIKCEVSTSHIPVLMLTACSLDEQKIQSYESGADGFISKPFSTELLLARCRNLIENRKRIMNPQAGGETPVQTAEGAPGNSGKETRPNLDIDDEFYRKFIEIFDELMGNAELNIEEIASRMGLGHSQFYRKIKALTNYSPVELMRKLRLAKARTLLTRTDKSISEVAYEVGFSTPAYFTRCYRTAYGETPTELRTRLGR